MCLAKARRLRFACPRWASGEVGGGGNGNGRRENAAFLFGWGKAAEAGHINSRTAIRPYRFYGLQSNSPEKENGEAINSRIIPSLGILSRIFS